MSVAESREIEIVKSACPLDCPDSCSLDVKVEAGRVVAVEGNHANPFTAGFICQKVHHFPEYLYGPERVRSPLLRVGNKGAGSFQPICWDEALDRITAEIQQLRNTVGGESILPYCYGGSNGFLTHDSVDARFFRRLGASRLARTVCAAATGRAAQGLYGKMPGVALEDYRYARLIILWGVNPSATGIHLVPVIRRAQKAGAKLVVLDPRRTPLAKQADLHLPIQAGTDLPVALSIIRWLFTSGRADTAFLAQHTSGADELQRRAEPWTFAAAAAVAGVDPATLEEFARLYADTAPAVIRCGWGLERNRNGGSAVAAVLALPAVAGKFGVRGGGFTMSNSGAWNLDLGGAVAAPEPATRRINMNLLGDVLLNATDPPIRLLFVYNSNALATTPAQEKVRAGLMRADLFTVVFEQVMTDTARYADIVLPATTFLEHVEVRRGYGAMVLQQGEPAIAPVGEARPNYAVFSELCRRLGLARPGDPETADELAAALLEPTGRAAEIQAAWSAGLPAIPAAGSHPIPFVDIFPPTADRKIHLCPADLDAEAPRGLYGFQPDPASTDYPLTLLSPASPRMITSTFGQQWQTQVPVELNPADAEARGIASGDRVTVYNELGSVICRAERSADLRPGIAVLPKGLWSHHTQSGTTANALAPDSLTDLGGGACFNDARVQIRRLEE